jgi:hypothetical protein
MSVKITAKPAQKDSGDTQKRVRSTIEFPYGDLDDAINVVNAIHTNAGFSCDTNQLAAYMKYTATSGTFRMLTATSSVFGLTDNQRGTLTLTALGKRIVDPAQNRQAKTEAFLAVPLYKAMFEKFKGHVLPPAVAVEREMIVSGVSSKQANKARQAFERSAEQAGFFAHGTDRLVLPTGGGIKEPPKPPSETPPLNPPPRSGNGGGQLPPFIQGLLDKLPSESAVWPIAERAKWLQTASNIFDLMYAVGEGDSISIINIEVTKL